MTRVSQEHIKEKREDWPTLSSTRSHLRQTALDDVGIVQVGESHILDTRYTR